MGSILEGVEILDKLSDISDGPKGLIAITSIAGLVITLFYLIHISIKLIQVFRLYVTSQYCRKLNLVKKYGQWAVVSGGGDGIGQAMARELAKRGMSIIVIDRDVDKLVKTKALLKNIPETGQVETLEADLSDWSDENFDKIRAQIDPDQRDIGVLINNVGTLPYTFQPIQSYTTRSITLTTNLNALATVNLTRMILPGMLQRKRGLLLNVASLAGSIPWAYMSVYAPTKAFVESFTRQVRMECRSTKIDVVLLKPGPVLTRLADPTRTQRTSLFLVSPEAFARSAINALSSGVEVYSGTFVHGLLRVIMETISNFGLFHLVAELAKRKNDANIEQPLKCPLDSQRIGVDGEDQRLDLAFKKPIQTTSGTDVAIEMTQKS